MAETETSAQSVSPGHPAPEPGWPSPAAGGGPGLTLGQALLAGSEGQQQYIHTVLQHITTAAAEKYASHRKRKHRRRSSGSDDRRKKGSHRHEKKERRKRRHDDEDKEEGGGGDDPRKVTTSSSSSASSSSSTDEEEGGKEWKRRRRESTMSPLLQMVMSDLSRGFFELKAAGHRSRQGGLPQGLGLGEGLSLGATSASSASTTMSSSASHHHHHPPQRASLPQPRSRPLLPLPRSNSLPPPHVATPGAPSSSSLLEPPRFPLMADDRRLPLPLPLASSPGLAAASPHRHPPPPAPSLPFVGQGQAYHPPQRAYPSHQATPGRQLHQPRQWPMHQLQPPQRQHHHVPHYHHHHHRQGSQQQPSEWSSADPPSDGDAESPLVGEATRTQHLPSMVAPPDQHDLTSETEIQSGRVVWRRAPPILPPPIPSLSSAPHFLGSSRSLLLPSWPSMGTHSPAYGQRQLHLPPPSDALHF